ncbi:hypothetical protein O3P69_008987 [Scylla paramamosain]|uniref:Slowpoke-binding protein n=1 Tax=Scylla paramamosain TaxID=85552 RepID=A0AAW0TR73_SCYPA
MGKKRKEEVDGPSNDVCGGVSSPSFSLLLFALLLLHASVTTLKKKRKKVEGKIFSLKSDHGRGEMAVTSYDRGRVGSARVAAVGGSHPHATGWWAAYHWAVLGPCVAVVALVFAVAYVVRKCERARHGGRYSYSALEDDAAGERLEMERKVARGTTRDTSALAARSYLRGHQRYSLLEHLRDIGSRIDKNWFIIRDASVKTERLMTLQPYDEHCPIPMTHGTREALIELFQALHHPYIYPVLDVDFANISSHTYIVTIIPHNNKGTLKDLIYRSHWQDDWVEKYQQRSSGLPVGQVQRLGRQVLEALLFLQDRGFPPCGHLHSGNVVLQNGVARLSGVENTLLGLTSRIYPIIKRRLKDNRDAIDSVCFGHVLFEMCAGYELSSAHPTAKHLEDISSYPQVVQVLEYIFGNGDQYPSIEEILCLDFFRNLDLREMRAAPLPSQFQIRYSPMIRNILKEVRRFQKQRRRGKRGGGTASGGEGGGDTPTSSEASAGGAGVGEDSVPPSSAYNTPSASLAALSSPTSDVTPSPEVRKQAPRRAVHWGADGTLPCKGALFLCSLGFIL